MGVTHTFISRSKEWINKTEPKLDRAALGTATVVLRDAQRNAPVDKANLVSSGRISREMAASYRVIFGSSSVRYAKKRHYENRKNPQTLRYLKRAGDANRADLVKRVRDST